MVQYRFSLEMRYIYIDLKYLGFEVISTSSMDTFSGWKVVQLCFYWVKSINQIHK